MRAAVGVRRECVRCSAMFRRKSSTIPFSSGDVNGWRVDFRWAPDLCELCALSVGLEDFAEYVLAGREAE